MCSFFHSIFLLVNQEFPFWVPAQHRLYIQPHPDELAQHWTLSPDECELLGNKAGATRLNFAVLLKEPAFIAWLSERVTSSNPEAEAFKIAAYGHLRAQLLEPPATERLRRLLRLPRFRGRIRVDARANASFS